MGIKKRIKRDAAGRIHIFELHGHEIDKLFPESQRPEPMAHRKQLIQKDRSIIGDRIADQMEREHQTQGDHEFAPYIGPNIHPDIIH